MNHSVENHAEEDDKMVQRFLIESEHFPSLTGKSKGVDFLFSKRKRHLDQAPQAIHGPARGITEKAEMKRKISQCRYLHITTCPQQDGTVASRRFFNRFLKPLSMLPTTAYVRHESDRKMKTQKVAILNFNCFT